MVGTIEVIVDGLHRISLDVNSKIVLIKQISDIRDFSKRTNPYTIPFTIPANSVNNKIFKHYNNLNITNGYNTNRKVSVSITDSGRLILDGYIQMNSYTGVNGKGYYEVTCYNNIGGVIDSNYNLKDLDLSEYDHIFNYENVIGSWDTFIWRNDFKYPFKKGVGYVYGYTDFDTKSGIYPDRIAGNSLKTEFFKTHIYAKTIWDKIYDNLDLSYTSDFLNSDLFSELVVTPDLTGLLLEGIDDLQFNVARGSDYTMATYTDSTLTYPYTDEVDSALYIANFNRDTTYLNGYGATISLSNTGNHFSLNNYTYLVPNKTIQDIKCKVFLTSVLGVYSDEYGNVIPECQYPYKTIHDGSITYRSFLYLNRGGVSSLLDSNEIDYPFHGLYGPTNCIDTEIIELPVSVSDYQFLAGDIVSVRTQISFTINSWISQDRYDPLAGYQRDFQVRTRLKYKLLEGSYLKNEIKNEYIQAGDPVIFNNIIPDMSQSDFIKSIVKMFNLYIYPDPSNIKNHIIEPYDVFFSKDSGVILDWKDKMDRKSELKIMPLDDISANKIKLTYKEDNDYLNSKYTDKYKEIFGEYTIDFNNDFVTSTIDEKISFSPTPLVNEIDTGKIISKIYKINSSGSEESFNADTRILFFNNYDCDTYTIIDDVDGTFSHTFYPYTGFLDDPFLPSNDLNFFACKEYYHSMNLIPLNNLYNVYWSNYYGSVIENQNLVIGYFYLTPKDLYEFSFRDLIYIDGNYYIVNKIEYSVSNTDISKVELIRTNYTSLSNKTINRNVEQFSSLGLQYIGYNGFLNKGQIGWNINFNGLEDDFINKNNTITGLNTISTNTLYTEVSGYGNMLSGEATTLKGYNNEISNAKFSFISGTGSSNLLGIEKSLVMGSGWTASSKMIKSITIGDDSYYNNVQKSLIIGDDIHINDKVSSSIIFGDSFTVSGTYSNSIIFGSTSSVNILPFNTLYEMSLSVGTVSYIPMFSGTNSITTSGLYYTGSNLTNGSFLLSNTGQLLVGGTTYSSGPAATQMLTVKSLTQSFIVVESTSSGTEIGTIKFNNGSSTYNSIVNRTTSMTVNAYSRFVTNVNSVDALIIDYGPRVGIVENATDATFKIKDSGVGYPFRISGTTSNTLLNYTNIGELVNSNDIEITGTASGYILRSPDNTRWRITIDNVGLISATSI